MNGARPFVLGSGFGGAPITFIAAVFAGCLACSVKNGSGEMHGSLNVPACSFGNDGTREPLKNQEVFSRELNYFVSEPFDSISARFPANQMNIRMQGTSARIEFADSLRFWVLDSYEVARCIRGAVNADGTDDWNPLICDRSVLGPDGEGRMFIGTEGEKVTSAFSLWDTCPKSLPSAVALGTCAGGSCPDLTLCPGRGSWIAFASFGSVPPKTAGLGRDFKVHNGETIRASAFHVELCDKATVDAQATRTLPIPRPVIAGVLEGSFSFPMEPGFR